MRNFFLGLFLGLILATGLTTFAQLAPIESNLHDRIQYQQMQNTLGQIRAVERMEQGLMQDPLLSPFKRPCP